MMTIPSKLYEILCNNINKLTNTELKEFIREYQNTVLEDTLLDQEQRIIQNVYGLKAFLSATDGLISYRNMDDEQISAIIDIINGERECDCDCEMDGSLDFLYELD